MTRAAAAAFVALAAAAFACTATANAAGAGATQRVTLSNTHLPTTPAGAPILAGEVDVLDNSAIDGYWYLYMSNWGCCRQVNCCTNSGPWPSNDCWECCDAQKHSACTYQGNHTIVGYRTRDFASFEDLGVLISPADRNPGVVFVPRILYKPLMAPHSRYVLWFENYNTTHGVAPSVGLYSIAVSASAAGPFRLIRDGPDDPAVFNCSASQGDFDLFTDDTDGSSYIILTHYNQFCIERLDPTGTAGTGDVAWIEAMDVHIPGHPPGDEAPSMFQRGELYYVTYASGCCGCKGGSITWAFTAPHPLGPWKLQGNLTPGGPVTRAQQRAVFRVPSPPSTDATSGGSADVAASTYTYIHVGNNWVPGAGGEGTCTNQGLLYWWVLEFGADGSIGDISWRDEVSFEMAVPTAREAAPPAAPAVRIVSHARAEARGDSALGANVRDDAGVDCTTTGVAVVPQNCSQPSPGATLSLTGSWLIAASSADTFTATELQRNLSAALPALSLKVVDLATITGSSSSPYIALGDPTSDAHLASLAAAKGVGAWTGVLAEPESYVLQAIPSTSTSTGTSTRSVEATIAKRDGVGGMAAGSTGEAVFLLGSDAPGTFYAAVTLMQLVRAAGTDGDGDGDRGDTASLPAWRIDDRPDTALRGYEVEAPPSGSPETFFQTVANTMAALKLNYVLLEAGLPISYDYVHGNWSFPASDGPVVAMYRRVMSYFAARHITVALDLGAKWDPRTLEAKAVTAEPFTFDAATGVAVADRPAATPYPTNGGFERVQPDGTPTGWSFGAGSTSHEVPCRIDATQAASGSHSVVCNVTRFPDPDPYPPARSGVHRGDATAGTIPPSPPPSTSPSAPAPPRGVRLGSEPYIANYSGPLSSDAFPILPGSMYELSFKAAWRGNWSGAFTGVVSLYQYESLPIPSDENPTDPVYPSTLNFIPCTGGDARHCGTGIARLPEWSTLHTTFITMPTARYVRVRAYVGGWGAGQFWVDDVTMTRVDGQLENVVRLGATDVTVTDAASGKALTPGKDYTITNPPPASHLDPAGNFSRLSPLVVTRVEGGAVPAGGRVNMTYNVLPGNANRMVGGRDVSCYVEERYYALLQVAVKWIVDTLRPAWLMADSFDEQMGMGRDTRTLESGLTNAEIVSNAVTRVNGIVRNASAGSTSLVIWADMLVRDHNGGTNYSWLNGAGRRQPYWPAIKSVPRDVLLLSWIYDESPYAQTLVRDDPAYFATYTDAATGAASPWVGCGWTDKGNIDQWAAAVRRSKQSYGTKSSAQGLLCTNWGGGRIETGLLPTAQWAWNLEVGDGSRGRGGGRASEVGAGDSASEVAVERRPVPRVAGAGPPGPRSERIADAHSSSMGRGDTGGGDRLLTTAITSGRTNTADTAAPTAATPWSAFTWRARVRTAPATSHFTFTYGRSAYGHTASNGTAWSQPAPFNATDAAAWKAEYPNSSLRGWHVIVTKIAVGGLDPNATSTTVDVELTDASLPSAADGDGAAVVASAAATPVTLTADLFGGSFGVMVLTNGSAPVTMRDYNARQYWSHAPSAGLAHPPQRFPIVNRFIGGSDDVGEWRDGVAALKSVGTHGVMLPPGPVYKSMLDDVKENMTSWAIYSPPGGAFDHALGNTSAAVAAVVDAWATKQAEPFVSAGYAPGSVQAYALADEPGWYLPGEYETDFLSNPMVAARWQAYLKAQGLSPADVGASSWAAAVPVGRDSATSLPLRRRFYWTSRFFSWDSANYFSQVTAAMTKAFGDPHMCMYANWNNFAGRVYVPGPVGNNRNKSSAAAAMESMDWFEFGRARGTTCLWTEDWFGDGQAYQWSYYASRLHSAASLASPHSGGSTFGGYIVPRSSGGGSGFLQKVLTLVGSGAKAVKYFTFGPEYNFPGNCYSEGSSYLLPAMAMAHEAIGRAESVLWPGVRGASRVGIVYPRSATMWDEWGVPHPTAIMDCTNNNMWAGSVDYLSEVAGVYNAIAQRANVPVDFVDETGLLSTETLSVSRFSVLWLTEPDVPAAGMAALVAWVKAGGTLVTVSGAGANDAYDQPSTVLSAASGTVCAPRARVLSGQLRTAIVNVTAADGSGTVATAMGVRGRVTKTAAASTVLATFDDDKTPAVVSAPVGKGRHVHFAFLPGTSHFWAPTPASSAGAFAMIRNFTTGLGAAAPVVAPVTVTNATSSPAGVSVVWGRQSGSRQVVGAADAVPIVEHIESPMLSSSAGAAVTLLNWRGSNITAPLNVTVHTGNLKVTKAESAMLGTSLKVTPNAGVAGSYSVIVPSLGAADIVTLTP